MDVTGAGHVARASSRQRHDEQVLIDAAGIVRLETTDLREIAIEAGANVDASLIAECCNGSARSRIDRRSAIRR
jgi:hypothetical protein